MDDEEIDHIVAILNGHDHEQKRQVLSQIDTRLTEDLEFSCNELISPLKNCIKSIHPQLCEASINTLSSIIHYISIKFPHTLKGALSQVLPIVLDKMGDSKPRIRELSCDLIVQAFIDAANAQNYSSNILIMLEKVMKEQGFSHKNSKTREQCLRWLLGCRSNDPHFHIKPYVPFATRLLEDSNESVRETAKTSIVALFKDAPPTAKADLKSLLTKCNVRKATMDFILSSIQVSASDMSDRGSDIKSDSGSAMGTSVLEEHSGRLPGPDPADAADIDVVYISSPKDLEHEFSAMKSYFDGRESEHNWLHREKSLIRIRGFLKGHAYNNFPDAFVAGLKFSMEGILKTLASLRTTLCLATCLLVRDLAIYLRTDFDPFADQFLDSLIKMSSLTKKLASTAAAQTATTVILYTGYSPRTMTYLWTAMQDKNVSSRQTALQHMITLISRHRKSSFEHGDGVDLIEKCLQKGLGDPNPVVREQARVTFWSYWKLWTDRGERIFQSLNPTAQKQLEKAKSKAITNPTIDQRVPENKKPTKAGPPGSMGLRKPITNGHRPPTPPVLTRKERTPSPAGSLPSLSRKLEPSNLKESNQVHHPPTSRILTPKSTLLQLLSHPDWNTRVDGLITVACLLAGKTPPEGPGKNLSLPSSSELASALLRLLNDPNSKVVEHLLAPEVLSEVLKVIPEEDFLMRLLLVAGDERQTAQSMTCANSLPGFKQMLSLEDAADLLSNCLQGLGISGSLPRKFVRDSASYQPFQKKRILHGILIWMVELIEHTLSLKSSIKEPNYFDNSVNYKLYMNRVVPLFNSIKEHSENFPLLVKVVKGLHDLNPEGFDRILSTFEEGPAKMVLSACGREFQGIETSSEVIHNMVDENVANVTAVHGTMPVIETVPASVHAAGKVNDVNIESAIPISETSRNQTSEMYTNGVKQEAGMKANLQPPMTIGDVLNDISFQSRIHKPIPESPIIASQIPLPETPESNKVNGSLSNDRKLADTNATKVPLPETPESHSQYKDKDVGVHNSHGLSSTTTPKRWWQNRVSRIPASTPLPKKMMDQVKLLESLMNRLEDRSKVDGPTFRKLLRISRENPCEQAFDENKDQVDIWENGIRFDRLFSVLIGYLEGGDISAELRENCILVIKSLLTYQTVYCGGHQDEIVFILLRLLSNNGPAAFAVYAASQDALSTFCELVPPNIALLAFESALSIFMGKNMKATESIEISNRIFEHGTDPVVGCLRYMKQVIEDCDSNTLMTEMPKIKIYILETLNDQTHVDLRKSAVDVVVAVQSVIQNQTKLFELFDGLTKVQQVLITYYLSKKTTTPLAR